MAAKKKASRKTPSKKTPAKKTPSKKTPPRKKWVRTVTTDSTHPPDDLFTKDAETIARVMASKKVSPKGIGSAVRMVQYFINRAGKNLSAARLRELEKAKEILQAKEPSRAKKSARPKTKRSAKRADA